MATKQNESMVASLLPDEMVAGGLADDFDGIVRVARYAPFDYQGTVDPPVLSIELTIERLEDGLEDDEKMVTQNWSAGDMKNFRPSTDGVNPTGEESVTDEEGNVTTKIAPGYFAVRVGQRTALNNNTNAAQLMRSILDAQFPRDKFSPDIRFIEGIKGHWNRLPPDKKGGQFKNQTPEQSEKSSKRDVLCLTRLDGYEKGGATGKSAAGKPVVATKPAASGSTGTSTGSTAASGGDIDAKLVEIIKSVVKPGAPAVKKTALSGAVLKVAKSDKDVQKMVKRVTTTEFLESLTEINVLYDAEAGTVEMIAIEE